MGWDYVQTNGRRVNVDAEFRDMMAKTGRDIVASARVGKVYYAAVRESTGRVWALVAVLDVKKHEFGYKAMDEGMHPYEYGCPASVLDALTPTESTDAQAWRNRCRADLALVAAQRALPDGALVRLENAADYTGVLPGDTYRVTDTARGRRYVRTRDQQAFQLPATAKLAIVEGE